MVRTRRGRSRARQQAVSVKEVLYQAQPAQADESDTVALRAAPAAPRKSRKPRTAAAVLSNAQSTLDGHFTRITREDKTSGSTVTAGTANTAQSTRSIFDDAPPSDAVRQFTSAAAAAGSLPPVTDSFTSAAGEECANAAHYVQQQLHSTLGKRRAHGDAASPAQAPRATRRTRSVPPSPDAVDPIENDEVELRARQRALQSPTRLEILFTESLFQNAAWSYTPSKWPARRMTGNMIARDDLSLTRYFYSSVALNTMSAKTVNAPRA